MRYRGIYGRIGKSDDIGFNKLSNNRLFILVFVFSTFLVFHMFLVRLKD